MASKALLALIFYCIAASCFAQSASERSQRDLREYSTEQLRACLKSGEKCGNGNDDAIRGELERRLPTVASEQLIACFDDWTICGVTEDRASGWPISDELARRGNPRELLIRYWNEPRWTIRDGIIHAAYHFDGPEVTLFMRKVFPERAKYSRDPYWIVNYLAKKGDVAALKELSTGRYRNQGCLQYQTSVALFGKWKYRPAIPYLVTSAVYDVCLNITGAAEESLRALYPESPERFDNLQDFQRFFCERAEADGFSVQFSHEHCSAVPPRIEAAH